jgi:LuxR family transcriptional activator of conjugal transfer of Ti plasmids
MKSNVLERLNAYSRLWPPHWNEAIAAAAVAADARPLLLPLINELGFDGLTCIALIGDHSPDARPGAERAVSLWSTGVSTWPTRYCEAGYASCDPRVTLSSRRLTPVIWDTADVESDAPLTRRFLAEAARQRALSGFAVSFRHATDWRVVVAFDSGISPLDDLRCASIVAIMGNLMLIAAQLHERVLRPRRDTLSDGGRDAGNLTHREQQCLRMAANGLTSGDIGGKLGIAERTVNFHMNNVLRKMDALNRPEAIAKALARGVLRSGAIA